MSTTIRSATDSDGNVYEVCKQSGLDTCVPASIFMYECLAKQASMKGGEDRIIKISAKFKGNAAASGGDGTKFDNILLTLQYTGARVLEIDDPGENFLGIQKTTSIKPGRISNTRPALVCVGWYDKYVHLKRSGGHAVVATRFSKGGKVVYLDPGEGDVFECVNNSKYGDNGLIEAVIYSG